MRLNRHGVPILIAPVHTPVLPPAQHTQRRMFEQQLHAKEKYWDARLAAQLEASRSYRRTRANRAVSSDSRSPVTSHQGH